MNTPQTPYFATYPFLLTVWRVTVARRRSIGAAAVAAVALCLAIVGAHVSAAAGANNQTFVYDASPRS